MPPLLAVPNVSEGSDAERLSRLEAAFTRGASLLMVTHSAQAERIADRVLRLTPEGIVAA